MWLLARLGTVRVGERARSALLRLISLEETRLDSKVEGWLFRGRVHNRSIVLQLWWELRLTWFGLNDAPGRQVGILLFKAAHDDLVSRTLKSMLYCFVLSLANWHGTCTVLIQQGRDWRLLSVPFHFFDPGHHLLLTNVDPSWILLTKELESFDVVDGFRLSIITAQAIDVVHVYSGHRVLS